MSTQSPAVNIYGVDGYEVAIQYNNLIPAFADGLLVLGSDGTNARLFKTSSDGTLRIDPTGTTTQPVSGTVSTQQIGVWAVDAYQGGVWNVAATQSGAWSVGQSGSWSVDQSGSWTVTANIGTTNGLALDSTLTGGTQTTKITDGTNTATVKPASTAAVATDTALVVAISPNNSIITSEKIATTATPANIPAAITSTTLFATNANRLGAIIFNDSKEILYIQLGSAATTTSFIQKLYPNSYWEVPFKYDGQINGVWAKADGAARVSELT
jgi:hypothetical protein